MAEIQKIGETTCLVLYGAYVPTAIADVSAGWPSHPKYYRQPDDLHFESREHAAAMTLSARARRSAGQLVGHKAAESLPLDVWCFAPAQVGEAFFARWFEHEPANTDLRLFIHSQPANLALNPSKLYKPPCQIRLRRGNYAELRRDALPLLDLALQAYSTSGDTVRSLFGTLGHSYWRGRWNPHKESPGDGPRDQLPVWLRQKLCASGWEL